MRNGLALTTLALVALAIGCEATNEAKTPPGSLNAWLVASIQNPQIDNAIIAQHTIYPYHFAPDSAELNELGERDLRVLAEHFTKTPGELNVNQGQAGDELYKARITSVVNGLARAGVDVDRMEIVDKLPGGDGMCTERLVKILEQEGKPAAEAPSGALYIGVAPTK